MTIVHKGIRRKTTDVLADYGQAFYCQNWRFKKLGELGRRPGIGKSNMAQMAGPVQAMIVGNWFSPYLVQVTGGTVDATLDPLAEWDDPILMVPDGAVGIPQAPTIVSVDPVPATPSAYQVGQVTWTVTVLYDGLSGPLIYNYAGTDFDVYPNNSPAWVGGAGNTFTYDFNAGSLPGGYTKFNPGTVDTTLNGFSVPIGQIDYLVT